MLLGLADTTLLIITFFHHLFASNSKLIRYNVEAFILQVNIGYKY